MVPKSFQDQIDSVVIYSEATAYVAYCGKLHDILQVGGPVWFCRQVEERLRQSRAVLQRNTSAKERKL
eukprot:3657933-Amphidinium_carterae.1